MALSVIGTGFGRTGTMSLQVALEMLGLGRCYHMREVFLNPGHSERWAEAADGSVDWDALLAGYGAAVDWPSTYFWRELAAHYPNAKLVHTERSPESWLKSAKATIFQAMSGPVPEDDPMRAAQKRMVNKLVTERTFGGNMDDDHLMSAFRKHNEDVRRLAPADRLLVYEVSQGWEPLCNFLGLPIPAAEFPKVNSTEEFRARNIAPK